MNKIKHQYRLYFTSKDFFISLFSSLVILGISLAVNFYASIYAAEKASNAVTDLILSNIRVFDVDGIFVYGPIVLWSFVALILLAQPRKIPFVLKAVAVFVLIRSFFVTLTHLGPIPTSAIIASTNIIHDFTSGTDYFFSGHTGLPFLLALLFWDNKYLRVLFTVSSVLFGIVVLMGHFHYSIDVLSAFFITYTIYHIAETLFPRDKKLFDSGLA